MPNCFQLTPKGQKTAEKLQDIDRKICEYLGKPVDIKYWYVDWYNSIGLGLAMGKNWQELRALFHDAIDLLPVIDYLEAHYDISAWYEHR